MSVQLDLTAVGPELLDAVIFMDKSPAFAAFKEEIEKILSDFNKTGRFGETTEIDVKALVDNSSDVVKNMHRSFLLWTFDEEKKIKNVKDSQYYTYLKLFFKGQQSKLESINGGKKSIDASKAAELKDNYISAVTTDPDLFNSLKEFFAGYVYGYFFNYLNEQSVMRDYAEFLVCLGIMSGKVNISESAKMKILPKMAMLLNNDRFKYISGEVPVDVILNIVNSRFDKYNLSEDETALFTASLKDYITKNYQYHESDGLVVDNVSADIMTRLTSDYINADIFATDLHKNTFDGNRIFLDKDYNDMGDYTVDRVKKTVADKCFENFNNYFNSSREPIIEVGIGADCIGYKYPLTYLDGDTYWFIDMFKLMMFPACDKSIYIPCEEDDLPIKMFPFAGPALKTNIIKILGGLESDSYSIRTDKRAALVEINALPQSKNLSDDDKKMMALEKLLYVISGNMDAASYDKLLKENVFGTKLYEDYIRYRMECIFAKGMTSLDTKKNLLDEVNRIK